MSIKTLNWGIVSTGDIADQFASDMAYVTNGHLLAVAARQQEDADTFAQKHSIDRAYSSYQALFDDPDIDVVYIATPHNFHFEQASAAIVAGKHVLCEKPITISSDECLALSRLAKQYNVFLMEALWTYFLPAVIKAKQWFDEGRIGKIKHIKADFGYPMAYDPNKRVYNKALAGGCLLDMGIYPLAIASYFLSPDKALTDWHVKPHFAPNGVEDDLVMLAKYRDVTLNLATSFQCKLNNYAYIIGEKGYIALHDFWRSAQCSLYVLDEEVERFEDNRPSIGLNFEAQATGEAILAGDKAPTIVTHQRSLWLQQQMEQIKSLL